MDDLFKLADSGGPPIVHHRTAPSFSRDDIKRDWPQYNFVSDPAESDRLARKDYLERVSGDRLEDVLGGTAEEAAEAILEGEVDDVLDFVLFAEQAHDDRVMVKSAIAERSDELSVQDAQQKGDAISTSDIVTG